MPNQPLIQMPPNSTVVERKIIEFAYANVYGLIPDPIDKFIIAFMFDLGNSQQATAIATGLCRKTIWKRHKRIKEVLKNLKVSYLLFNE